MANGIGRRGSLASLAMELIRAIADSTVTGARRRPVQPNLKSLWACTPVPLVMGDENAPDNGRLAGSWWAGSMYSHVTVNIKCPKTKHLHEAPLPPIDTTCIHHQ